MSIYKEGDQKKALCFQDGRVTVTFEHRNVPFSSGHGIVPNILVGVCSVCGSSILIPAQSTEKIAKAKAIFDSLDP